jgi:uncharacterized protein (TIGR00369 family)
MTTDFQPRDPDFERRVRDSFARQNLMETLGAELLDVRPGEVAIALPFDESLTQQHGYLHAATITAIADSACGYAALSLSEPGREVLAVEFKINLLAPGEGELFVARARVLRPGRTLTVCSAEVFARQGDEEVRIAAMQATMFGVSGGEADE